MNVCLFLPLVAQQHLWPAVLFSDSDGSALEPPACVMERLSQRPGPGRLRHYPSWWLGLMLLASALCPAVALSQFSWSLRDVCHHCRFVKKGQETRGAELLLAVPSALSRFLVLTTEHLAAQPLA